ncbi:RNA polymerase sigma factor RpoE [Roseivivax isoporae LMG 25204]|uniref:RNA polymerase sigma factor RpoE n=2 Tax=Roseivivax TaxID=93682 RepID=X7F2H3_9RHOB|nr:RNA polymerase sigma factor RpoE [Roseivivax isoporae LMG 25204]
MSGMFRDVENFDDFEPDTPFVDPVASAPGPSRVRTGVSASMTSEADPAIWAQRIHDIRTSRSEAAFVALFEHFAPRIKAFLMRSGADATLAEEVVQEVFSTVWRKAHLFDPSRASASTWIFTIARNKRIDMIRKHRRPEPEDLPWGPENDPEPAEALGMQQDAERLAVALAKLPEKQRHLIEKAYFGDLSHSEIATETGLPLGTIKSRIRLALDRLRHAMT